MCRRAEKLPGAESAALPLALRPHHGMCLAFFSGKGYSEEFSAHMSEVLGKLEAGVTVRLTLAPDVICSACPNLADGSCEASGKASGYDRAVLAKCGLMEGDVLPFPEFAALVEEKLLSPGRRPSVCGSCQWDGLCRRTESRWQKQILRT